MLYVYSDKPLIVQTVQNILESSVVDRVVVITGYMSKELERVLREAGYPVDIIENPEYATGGMSSSIKTGVLYTIKKYGIPLGIMVNPGDVAWVHPGVYALVASKFLEVVDRYKIVVAGYRGRRGHPIIFSTSLLSELLSISEERKGLKEVVEKHGNSVLVVETEYPGVLLDLDTLLDILRVKSTLYK